MKRKEKGFTIVELLTVLAIITMLVGLLIPSLNMVRNIAKQTKQKAQLTTIDQALLAFRDDYGDYPPSDRKAPPEDNYCGGQKLAEALLGRDLLGFHPKSTWSANDNTWYPPAPAPANLEERKDRYLELATTNVFRIGDLYTGPMGSGPLASDTFAICDAFGVKPIRIGNQTVKAGTPILYYKANVSAKTIREIYNVSDNVPFTSILKSIVDGKDHPLGDPTGTYRAFYGDPTDPTVMGYIQDPKITTRDWPYRPDSYILISAGADGLYGTNDDICNFGK